MCYHTMVNVKMINLFKLSSMDNKKSCQQLKSLAVVFITIIFIIFCILTLFIP